MGGKDHGVSSFKVGDNLRRAPTMIVSLEPPVHNTSEPPSTMHRGGGARPSAGHEQEGLDWSNRGESERPRESHTGREN